MSDSRLSDPGLQGTVDDLFLARTVPFAFHGVRLRFDLATTLFSSAGIDPGSAMLLRHLQTIEIPPAARVLDLGCGVGVLGMVLGATDRSRSVTFVDRDALACRFTLRNLANNDLDTPSMTVGGSLGYDDVAPDPPFDLIVSNIPGKAGDTVLRHLIEGIGPRARVGTIVGFVVVQPLAVPVRDTLARLEFEPLLDKGNRTHQVFIARTTVPLSAHPAVQAENGFEAGIYDRHTEHFRVADLQWRARTVTGLDEFDNLSHTTKLLRGAFRGVRAGSCRILDPGQGHRAVIAARSGQRIEALVSRDLLALRASVRCLEDNGLAGPEAGPTLHHGLMMSSAEAVGLPAGDAASGSDMSVAPCRDPRQRSPARSGAAPVATVLLHADDKAHTPWFVAEVRAQLDRWGAGRGRHGDRREGRADAGAGRSVERHLILSGRASLLGRIEVDVLARSGGRLAHKQTRAGYRVLRYQFGS